MSLITKTRNGRIILGLMTFGYDEIDTTRVYVGVKQEGWTRDAKWKDRGFTLATKVWPYQPGVHEPESLKEHFNTSLRELGTDSVDIVYLHAPDRSVPFEKTLEAVNELHKQGKLVQLGLSNYAAWEVAEIWNIANERGLVKPTIYQAMCNAITRTIEPELIPACRKYQIDIVIKSADIVPDDGRFGKQADRVESAYRECYFKKGTFDALKIVENAAQKHSLTLLEIALRWTVHHAELKPWNKGGNDGVIIGVSSFSQLEGNLADLEKGPLPDDVVQAGGHARRMISNLSFLAIFSIT